MLVGLPSIFDLGKIVHDEFDCPFLTGSSIDDGTPQLIFAIGAAVLLEEPVISLFDVVRIFG